MFEGLFQPMHMVVILGLALLIFGPKKLPELGKGLGDGIRTFKSAIKGDEKELTASEPSIAGAVLEIAKAPDSN
jgi:sec-independent protein translocase protein TatA